MSAQFELKGAELLGALKYRAMIGRKIAGLVAGLLPAQAVTVIWTAQESLGDEKTQRVSFGTNGEVAWSRLFAELPEETQEQLALEHLQTAVTICQQQLDNVKQAFAKKREQRENATPPLHEA